MTNDTKPDTTPENLHVHENVTKLIITALQARAEQQSPARANPYRVLATAITAGDLTITGSIR
ncbi:hypothetical protein HJ590_13320 [Naumannella sp. ID2617S]|nr:hypothetical protein [Naumannella sp. ID2617S]